MNFDLNNTPIERGATLIEASAGTGKTYTIAGLFLRLILEADLSVREILVVTYTVAATEELRGRIREVISQAAITFRMGSSKIPFLQALYEQHRAEKEEILVRLERALCGFDEAPIYSIHGFCQKILKDRAFESASLFDTELVTDVSSLLQEMADDYWRTHFYRAHPLCINFALKNGFSPERLLPLLRTCLNHPFIKLISPVEGESVEQLCDALVKNFEKAKEIWLNEKAQIKSMFGAAQKKNWANSPYNDDETVADYFDQLDKCFSSKATFLHFDCLEKFCQSSLVAKTGKNKQTPQHEFFEACEALCQSEEQFLLGLQVDFYRFALTDLPRRKNRLKIQSFDDLLTRLHSALQGTAGKTLAKEVRKKYPAALIDEFQDTDPIQYQIFNTIFSDEENYLFLIGDPKQAIYGFRGADIFTYMQAARKVTRRFSLEQNWRSETGLVEAVNAIFKTAPRPFAFEEIEFHPVAAKGDVNKAPLRMNGALMPPFELWFWPRIGKHITKDTAESELPRIVAAEISRLLSGNVCIGERKLKPEDIAVLVLEHRQAQLVQEALSALNIPSVQQTNANLFDAEDVEELHRVLMAIAQPANERLLKAALATSLLGFSGDQLGEILTQGEQWQGWLERFHGYFETWTNRGFVQMFRRFLHQEKIRSRLLSVANGERKLTNVLHLGEVLHQAASEQRLGVNGLLKWLADKRSESGPTNDEENQLRLERDENAVKLVTIHKSKGLEYGVVFCPFAWKHSDITRNGEDEIAFHDRESGQFIRDLGSEESGEHRRLAMEEKLAENLRLLYVALTRAKHRCYFVWGHFYKSDSSAPAWLFHQPQNAGNDGMQALQAYFKGLTDEAMLADLKALENAALGARVCDPQRSGNADGLGKALSDTDDSPCCDSQSRAPGCGQDDVATPAPIRVSDLPNNPGVVYRPMETAALKLAQRRFRGVIAQDWKIASFSWLTKQEVEELPDRDEREDAVVEPASGIFAFPKGSRPGTCLHEIFEDIDFSSGDEVLRARIVNEKLRNHGFDEKEFSDVVCQAVNNVLTVPLQSASPALILSKISNRERLTELEFYFPIQELSVEGLRKVFARHGSELWKDLPMRLGKLMFDPVRGFMKGFIDLVFQHDGKFYLADWKSNWLGNTIEHYSPDAIRGVMAEKHYLLQYHLYTLALHKYLEKRMANYDYEKHFGGVFYIFLRGVDPKRPEYGVFRDRPSLKMVEGMEGAIIRKRIAGEQQGLLKGFA